MRFVQSGCQVGISDARVMKLLQSLSAAMYKRVEADCTAVRKARGLALGLPSTHPSCVVTHADVRSGIVRTSIQEPHKLEADALKVAATFIELDLADAPSLRTLKWKEFGLVPPQLKKWLDPAGSFLFTLRQFGNAPQVSYLSVEAKSSHATLPAHAIFAFRPEGEGEWERLDPASALRDFTHLALRQNVRVLDSVFLTWLRKEHLRHVKNKCLWSDPAEEFREAGERAIIKNSGVKVVRWLKNRGESQCEAVHHLLDTWMASTDRCTASYMDMGVVLGAYRHNRKMAILHRSCGAPDGVNPGLLARAQGHLPGLFPNWGLVSASTGERFAAAYLVHGNQQLAGLADEPAQVFHGVVEEQGEIAFAGGAEKIGMAPVIRGSSILL